MMLRLFRALFSWIEDPLHPVGLVLAAIGAGFAIALALLFYAIVAPETSIPLYRGFPEWQRAPSSEPIVCLPPTTPSPFDTQALPQEMLQRATIIRAMLATDLGQIAQWGRVLTIVLSMLAVFVAYRSQLVQRFVTVGDMRGEAIFTEHRKTLRDAIGGRIVVALSVGIVAYVLASLLWMYIGHMFAGVNLPLFPVLVLIFAYSFVILYLVIRWVMVLRTQDILVFGLLTFAIGLFGAFGTVADQCWWQQSIRYVGTDPQAEFLFAITLLGVSAMFAVMLIDLQKMARILVEDGIIQALDVRLIVVVGVGMILGISGIAVAPINGDLWVQNVHKASVITTSLLIIGSMFAVPLRMPRLYKGVYRWLSPTLGILSIVYVLLYLAGWINFVALELLLFAGFGLWLFLTVHTLMRRVGEVSLDPLRRYLRRVYPPRNQTADAQSLQP
ncbi:MAG: hypothetical protein KC496_01425, partial [Anaerolineae bacterium]|nr:hypothetical protein [Anaerolineae bacterium]